MQSAYLCCFCVYNQHSKVLKCKSGRKLCWNFYDKWLQGSKPDMKLHLKALFCHLKLCCLLRRLLSSSMVPHLHFVCIDKIAIFFSPMFAGMPVTNFVYDRYFRGCYSIIITRFDCILDGLYWLSRRRSLKVSTLVWPHVYHGIAQLIGHSQAKLVYLKFILCLLQGKVLLWPHINIPISSLELFPCHKTASI